MVRLAPLVAVVVALFGVNARPAAAVVDGLWFSPMSPYWEWENPPLHGRVAGYRYSERRMVTGPTGVPGAEAFWWMVEFDWTGQALRAERLVNGGTGKADVTITFDSHGRRSSVSFTSIFDAGRSRTGRLLTQTKRAAYDAAGNLQGLTIERTDGKRQVVTAHTTVASDGSRTAVIACRSPGPQGAVEDRSATLTYGPDGRLVRCRQDIDGRPWMSGPVLTYNDHGDVASSDMPAGRSHDAYTYDYEYDAQGNWTRRTVHRHVGQPDLPPGGQLWEVIERRFRYLDATGGTKASASQTASTPATLAGTFVATQPDPGGGPVPFSTSTLRLLPDGTVGYRVDLPDLVNRGSRLYHDATGRWAATDDNRTLTVVLAPVAAGPPLPPDQATRRYGVSADGRTLTSDHPGEPAFARRD